MTVNSVHRFPQDPVLVRLLIAANRTPKSKVVIHDAYGFEKTYLHLLGDVLQTRKLLRARLAASSTNAHGLLEYNSRYIGLISKSGYQSLVAFFAIRSMGGAPVILSSGILPVEAHYLLSKANASCIVVGGDCMEKAGKVVEYVNKQGNAQFFSLPVSCDAEPLWGMNGIEIDDKLWLAVEDPGAVLFTSGTTGRPKMVAHPRTTFAYTELAEPGSAIINYRPIHWVGGLRCLMEAIVTGMKVFAMKEKPGAMAILETFRDHRITSMSFSPMTLRRLKLDLMSMMEEDPRPDYASWFSGLSLIRCGGSMVDPSTMEFWSNLTGRPVEIFYGATELAGPCMTGIPIVQNAIGTPMPGVKVKLSEGDHGEILVKSPRMFTHYFDDEKATQEAFDDEGYYKTGDLAEFRDGQYVFSGRANSDFVLYRFSKIPTLLVENRLLGLPYISEACVLGVPHTVAKELCGAVLRLRPHSGIPIDQETFARIRSDLAETLPKYMLPTLLRILRDDETLPVTSSGKPIKKEIRRDFFKTTDWWPIESPPADVICWSNKVVTMIGENDLQRPWDWCGMQMAD